MSNDINQEMHDNLNNITIRLEGLLSEFVLFREQCKTNIINERPNEFINLVKLRLADNYSGVNADINKLYEQLDKLNTTEEVKEDKAWDDKPSAVARPLVAPSEQYDEDDMSTDDEIEEAPMPKAQPGEPPKRKSMLEKLQDRIR